MNKSHEVNNDQSSMYGQIKDQNTNVVDSMASTRKTEGNENKSKTHGKNTEKLIANTGSASQMNTNRQHKIHSLEQHPCQLDIS